jgi:hypothetical protein
MPDFPDRLRAPDACGSLDCRELRYEAATRIEALDGALEWICDREPALVLEAMQAVVAAERDDLKRWHDIHAEGASGLLERAEKAEAEAAVMRGQLEQLGFPFDTGALAAAEREPNCICPHFTDTGGFRIADLTCPVHGPSGTNPGDGPWDAEREPSDG